MINAYPAAFASWWCHLGRYLCLPEMITGGRAAVRSVGSSGWRWRHGPRVRWAARVVRMVAG
jgi:hypothetical protein